MSLTRYFNDFLPNAVKKRILSASPVSFSSSFVTACRFWFAGNSIWATLVVAACIAVAMRLRIDKSWPLIAVAILLSAFLALRELWNWKPSAKTLLVLILGFASTGFLLWPSLTKGAFVSVAGDPFFYSSFGQYLADHHRGVELSGLSPIDHFGAVLSETRFGTASILSLFSVLFHSTTVETLPIFTLIVLVSIFSGFVVLSRKFGCNRLFSLAAGILAVIGGWTSNALQIGALDNLLFLSLCPFLVVRLELYRGGSKSWSNSLGLAILTAAVFYVYPEGLAIAGVIFLPFFCQSVWSGIYRQRRAWRHYLISGCLVLILIAPGIRVFLSSLFEHLNTGGKELVGLIFPGLLSSRFLPAMFGFGQEYAGIMYLPHDLVLPIIMLAFIVLGCATWLRRNKSLVLVFLIFIMMAMWQGFFAQNDYGLYKVIFIGSLIWIPALFLGGTAVAGFVPRPKQPFAVTVGTIFFFGGTIFQRMEHQNKIPWTKVLPIKWYADLAHLRNRVGNRPVMLVCDNAFDQEHSDFDQDWALFFLKHVNLIVPKYIGVLGLAFDQYMQGAKSISEPAAFVLINGPIEGAVWKNERFSLFEFASQAEVITVQAPNGLEHVNGKPFVWVGNTAARFLIVSKIAQTVYFSALECLAGLSSEQSKDRQIRISIGGNVSQTDVTGALSIKVPLKPGLNFLEIASQDSPAISADPDGDPRALPLGLWDYRISDK
jgi:hypothetical protein